MSAHLQTRIAVARRAQLAADIAGGVAWLAVWCLLASVATMTADWWFDLAVPARAAALLANAGIDGYVAFRCIFLRLQSPPDDDAIALRVERATPSLRSRLIVALQLARLPGLAGTPLVRHLVAEVERAVAEENFLRAVRWRHAAVAVATSLAVLTGCAALYQHMRPASGDLLRRLFLAPIPVPRKTAVVCPTGNRVVAKGDALTIEARARGVVPAQGTVTLLFADGRSEMFTMTPVSRAERARFQRVIVNVQESFSYRVKLNDGVSETFHVEARPRPSLASLRCTQVWPKYTERPPTPRALGDLTLLAGSRLQLEGVATKTLTQAVVRRAGMEVELPLTVDGKTITGTLAIPAKGLRGFSVGLMDADGLTSTNEVEYRVEIIPDKPPLVKLTSPAGREELVTASGAVWIGFEAEDDFGIADVAIHFKTDVAGKDQVIAFDLNGEQPKSLRRRFEWRMPSLKPALMEGATIEWWIEAMDSNDATGPGVTATEHRFLKIVSEMEKRAELMNRLDEYLGQLGTVADNQLKLNQNLGEIIRQKSVP